MTSLSREPATASAMPSSDSTWLSFSQRSSNLPQLYNTEGEQVNKVRVTLSMEVGISLLESEEKVNIFTASGSECRPRKLAYLKIHPIPVG